MDLRLVHGTRTRDIGDELRPDTRGKRRKEFTLVVHVAPVADDAAELYRTARSKAAHALCNIVRRIQRHELARGDNVDLLGVSLANGNGKSAADYIAEDVVEYDIQIVKGMKCLQALKCYNDPASGAANPRIGAARLDAAHTTGALMDEVAKRECCALLLTLEIEDLVQYPLIKNQWLELYDKLREYPIHYQRKQNQLYPLLEKKGFDRPTTTMWNFDDLIRDEIKAAYQLLQDDKDDEFIAAQQEIIAHTRDLMEKEETILYPTSLALITPAEFEDMKHGDQEIGFAFIDVAKPTTTTTAPAASTDGFAADLQALLSKYGYAAGPQQELDVTTGKLTLEQINLIYQHLPVDISFVDENELVKFYSDTDHRVFPRSKNVIGRKVENCHPRKSVHIVKEIVEKFRSGEQSKAEFWINKPGMFIYIIYFAVRDAQGRFRGVLEMMQDCTHIRALEGSQTLLTWAGKDEEKPAETAEQAPEKEEETPKTVIKDIEITPETRLADVFEAYPHVKDELASRYLPFKMLKTPLGKIMLKKATIHDAGERSGLGEKTVIIMIKEAIAKKK